MALETLNVEAPNLIQEPQVETKKSRFEEVRQKLDLLPEAFKKDLISFLLPGEEGIAARKWLKDIFSAVENSEPGSLEHLEEILSKEVAQAGEQNQILIEASAYRWAKTVRNEAHQKLLLDRLSARIDANPQLADIDYATAKIDTSFFPEVLNKYLAEYYPIFPHHIQRSIKIDYTSFALYALGAIGSAVAAIALYQKGWLSKTKIEPENVEIIDHYGVCNITHEVAKLQNKTRSGEIVFVTSKNETNSSSFNVNGVNVTASVGNFSTGNSAFIVNKTEGDSGLDLDFDKVYDQNGTNMTNQSVIITPATVQEDNSTLAPNVIASSDSNITGSQNGTVNASQNISVTADENVTANQSTAVNVSGNTTDNQTIPADNIVQSIENGKPDVVVLNKKSEEGISSTVTQVAGTVMLAVGVVVALWYSSKIVKLRFGPMV